MAIRSWDSHSQNQWNRLPRRRESHEGRVTEWTCTGLRGRIGIRVSRYEHLHPGSRLSPVAVDLGWRAVPRQHLLPGRADVCVTGRCPTREVWTDLVDRLTDSSFPQ